MTSSVSKPSETAPSRVFEIAFDHYDPADERRRESLLSIGNGLIHCRASAPEEVCGERHYPGLYRAGLYARLSGHVEGEDVSIDSLANLPNWLPLAFRLEGEEEWMSFDCAEILAYRQELDLATAVLTRAVTFCDAKGRISLFREERFVSMDAPHLAALRTSLQAQNWSGRVEIRSGIDGTMSNALAATEGGYKPDAVHIEHSDADAGCLIMRARSLATGVEIAVSTRTRLLVDTEGMDDGRTERGNRAISRHWTRRIEEGGSITIEKVASVFTSRDPAIGSPADAASAAVRVAPGFDELRTDHERAWKHLWGRCRMEVDNENLARGLALHAFHLLQTASPHASACDAGLPSRGWQEAYHGQIFWDETLSLPFLTLHLPEVARSALIYRHRRLGAARLRAREFGLDGALYPWRSATTGAEETPTFQQNPRSGRWHRDDTRLQFHVGSAIAHNVWQYFLATRDIDFMAGYGAEIMVEVARMWASLAKPHPTRSGRFTIRGVVGPDEFHTAYPDAASPGLDDNTYTNVTAAWTMLRAGEALERLPACHREAVRSRVKLAEGETAGWRKIVANLHLPTDADGLFLPFDRYDTLKPFDLEAYEAEHPGERIDWALEAEGRDVNTLQVMKQAEFAMLAYLIPAPDLIELLSQMGAPTTPDRIRRTVEADLKRTSHDSSLSDLVYAGALARLSPRTGWTIFREALHPDEKAGHSGTEKGVHLGAMAATLDIVYRIYLGLRPGEDALVIDPAPPPDLGRIRVHLLFRSNSLSVQLEGQGLFIRADPANHEAVPLLVQGEGHRIQPGQETTFTLTLGASSQTRAA